MQLRESWIYDEKWIGIKTLCRKCLHIVYRFDPWHVSPINQKEYGRYLIKVLGKMKRKGVLVEVGCGLGDVIGNIRINGSKRYGFDISLEAIKCATLLYPNVIFEQGSIDDVRIGKIHVLIMVNWCQGIDKQTISSWIKTLLDNNTVDLFVVDRFYMKSASYPFCHDWGEILGDDYSLLHRSRGFNAAEDNRRYIEFWKREGL